MIEKIIYCLMLLVLVALSVEDYRTMQILPKYNHTIFMLGLIRIVTDHQNWKFYVAGFFAVSSVLVVLWFITKGTMIGAGDIKMMAVCGLVLGKDEIWAAFFLGCVFGLAIHSIRMKICGAGRVLAMGPYFSMGIGIVMVRQFF